MISIHKPFHQKYRPKNLDELVGQEFISITLKQALKSKKIAPAYLFNGPRGTGKTSCARIFAKSLNCLTSKQPTPEPCDKCELCKQITDANALDVIEIDAASNTGVENIREIIERARFAPTQARWKVYVIDECHMLSTAASNALLKTIEEPPGKVVFILATTNPERVLNTIKSRCQKFDFRRIRTETIFDHLSFIAKQESIKFEDRALKLIAKRSNGGMRDAQSLLDQLSLMPDGVLTKNVQNLLGEVSENELIKLIESLINNDPESLIINCNRLYDSGNEPHEILLGLLNITRDLLLKTNQNNYSELFYTSIEFQNELNKFSDNLEKATIIAWHKNLKNVDYQIKTSDNPRLWLEIHLTSLLNISYQINKKELEKTLPDIPNNSANKKELEKTLPDIPNNSANKKELEKTLPDIPNNSTNKKNRIQEYWQLILSNLELPSTKMLLSQQAELISFDSKEVEIALSPNWENMIKSRKVVIEDALRKISGDHIQIKFSTKQINQGRSETSIDQSNIVTKEKSHFKKRDSDKNLSSEAKQNNVVDNSPKNLANFFNGEIIDINE